MLAVSIPTKFTTPFAADAGAGFIRTIPLASQIGITNGAASLTDGFPPLCFEPISSGGVPPFGQDFNGVLNQITLWLQWLSAGASNPYDPVFAAFIGGYPFGGQVQSSVDPSTIWTSTVDNNLTNPDAAGGTYTGSITGTTMTITNVSSGAVTNGQIITGAGVISNTIVTAFLTGTPGGNGTYSVSKSQTVGGETLTATGAANWSSPNPTTGDVKFGLKTVADVGWVMMNDGTIGNASSNATTLAAATTLNLFELIWNNVTNTYAQLYTSGGSPTARGASAGADYAANRAISLPAVLGRAMAISGAGSGLTSRALGQIVGEENHTLVVSEMPAHTHTVTDPGHTHSALQQLVADFGTTPFNDAVQTGGTTGSATTGISLQNTGGGNGHNTMQPTSFFNVMIKL